MTRARRARLVVLAGALGLAWPFAAAAEDFVLTVPVRVSQLLPGIRSGVVACVVGPPAIAGTARPNSHPVDRIGFGVATFPIDQRTRGFTGPVTVVVDAEPGRDAGAATHYKCWLQLGAGEEGTVETALPGPDAAEPHLVPRPNTAATLVVTGELPR
jgi:hypothetical protein